MVALSNFCYDDSSLQENEFKIRGYLKIIFNYSEKSIIILILF